MVTELKTNTFDKTIKNADQPVVVDFWAEWCGPCRMFAPTMEEIAEKHKNQVKFCKLNISEEEGIAERYGVMNIPTLILFKDGAPVSQIVGVQTKDAVETFIGV